MMNHLTPRPTHADCCLDPQHLALARRVAPTTRRRPKPLVLVVGGSQLQRAEISHNLHSLYRIRLLPGPSQVLQAISQEKPAAVAIDEALPPRGGAQLIAAIRNNPKTRSIPIVFTCRSSHADVKAEAISYNNVQLVEKPFKRGSFVDALSGGMNALVEESWDDIEPIQKSALKNTLRSFHAIADLVQDGQPIPYDNVRESCSPLVEAVQNGNFKSILEGVSNHDNYTYVHSLRVATFLTLFGTEIGITGDDLMTLSIGGLLHDVGKMHIPHEVLNKPGKLTEQELATMRSHVDGTVDVLEKTSELPKAVLLVAGQHHEKVDGSGYPHGIQGMKLNELSRMAAIIDIFSALTDRRVYKDPIPPDQALKIMVNMEGQLDQHILSMFREMLLDGAA